MPVAMTAHEEHNTVQLSIRMGGAIDVIMPKIRSMVEDRMVAALHPEKRKIDLGTAENALLHPEITRIYLDALQNGLKNYNYLPYPEGFGGAPELVNALAMFFNKYFHPQHEVSGSQIVVATGATSCLESMLHCICDPGEAVLVPAPYWSKSTPLPSLEHQPDSVIVDGFNVTFSIRPSVRIIPVGCDGSVEDTLSSIDYFEASLESVISASKIRVRALVLTNPHNPFGRCYAKEIVKLCATFCQKYNIHFISDEVYALSVFEGNEVNHSSALQLDLKALEVDPNRVHVIWSTSKDFGSSGVRVGAIVSQANERLRASLALASNIQVSSLAAIATTGLLNCSELDQLLSLNRQRLRRAHEKITAFFKANGIHYLPATGGPFIFAKLPGNISSLVEEQRAVDAISSTGLTVSPGTNYAWSKREFGWVRITFAVEPSVLDQGLERLVHGLKTVSSVLQELRKCQNQ